MAKYVKKKNRIISVQLVINYVLVTLLVVMSTIVIQGTKYERQIEELVVKHEAEMEALRDELSEDYAARITELKQKYEYGGDIEHIELEAEYIAKVIYGTARDHADADKRAVIWCILNRVEHHSHPNSVIEVCEQPKQWMGYSSENPILTDIYDLALAELKIWYNNGHRPMSNEYVYLSWSSKEIILRNTFEENKNTRYWRMS